LRPTLIKISVTLALLLVFVFVLSQMESFSLAGFLQSLEKLRLETVLIAFLLVALQNLLMCFRIWFLFPKNHAISLGGALHGVFYGQCVNMFLPARAGDLLKLVIFSKSMKSDSSQREKDNYPFFVSGGVLVSDKVVDILSLIICIIFSGSLKHLDLSLLPKISGGTLAWIALVLFLISLFLVFLGKDHFKKGMDRLRSFKEGMLGALNLKQLTLAFGVGILGWSCEALALSVLCKDQSLVISFSQSMYLLAVLNLAIAVPLAVANVGPFEAALVYGLGQLGLEPASSLATAAAHHSLQMVAPALLAGFFALIKFYKARRLHERKARV